MAITTAKRNKDSQLDSSKQGALKPALAATLREGAILFLNNMPVTKKKS
jgi:hypothetical protein